MKLTEMIRDTEVKLVLNSKRALRGKAPADDLKKLFGINGPAEPMQVWYVDTPDQKLRKAGWSVRYRLKNDTSLELTYKKRYSESGYRAMLLTKMAQGFAKDFTPELDMGYTKKTCSLSSIRVFDQEVALDPLEARRLVIINSPRMLTDWNGKNKGFAQLCESVLFGPVDADTYKGDFAGLTIKLEIWPLGSCFTELSFDIKSDQSAKTKARVAALLEEKRLAQKTDILKTDAMLDHYAKRKRY